MPLLGKAALAMWWDVTPSRLADFEDWHTHEHLPERLGVPGFRRAARWRSATGGEGLFVIYELDGYEVLASPAYLARLNAPTPWSTRMMPEHRNMVRSQCRVLESRGLLASAFALTVRLSPAAGRGDDLRAGMHRLAADLPMRPGIAGFHLLRHQTPAIARTEEQRIRGNTDRAADWIVVACGYESAALEALAARELGGDSLAAMGAAAGAEKGLYALSCTAVAADVA